MNYAIHEAVIPGFGNIKR